MKQIVGLMGHWSAHHHVSGDELLINPILTCLPFCSTSYNSVATKMTYSNSTELVTAPGVLNLEITIKAMTIVMFSLSSAERMRGSLQPTP